MNAHQRRKAIRAGTHYRCDNCEAFEPMPYIALTGCRRCWSAAARRRERYQAELERLEKELAPPYSRVELYDALNRALSTP
jgi:hypothetical protein